MKDGEGDERCPCQDLASESGPAGALELPKDFERSRSSVLFLPSQSLYNTLMAPSLGL